MRKIERGHAGVLLCSEGASGNFGVLNTKGEAGWYAHRTSILIRRRRGKNITTSLVRCFPLLRKGRNRRLYVEAEKVPGGRAEWDNREGHKDRLGSEKIIDPESIKFKRLGQYR